MNEEILVFGKGIKIWSVICIIISAFALIANCALGLFDMAVIGAASCIAYVLLLVKKRKIAFYSIVIFAIIVLVLNVVKYNVGILSSLFGLLNPVITFIFLSKYWKQMV